MAFFPNEMSQEDGQLLVWRDMLYRAIVACGWPKPKTIGVKALYRLRRDKGSKTLADVIAWYIDHMKEDYVPRVRSSEELEEKFTAIQEAMDRSVGPLEGVSEEARQKAESLELSYPFPIEVRSALPQIVQATMDGWVETVLLLVKEIRKDPNPREGDFAAEVLDNYSGTFVNDWMAFISRRHGRHDHYHGPVMMLAYRSGRKEFRESFWHNWAYGWCGNPTAFDALLDRIIGR